jgi:hypothetical protein
MAKFGAGGIAHPRGRLHTNAFTVSFIYPNWGSNDRGPRYSLQKNKVVKEISRSNNVAWTTKGKELAYNSLKIVLSIEDHCQVEFVQLTPDYRQFRVPASIEDLR